MIVLTSLFYLFAAILLLAAVGVVFFKNPVHAALSLVVAFVFSACLWLMLQAEFLALILILVYVGAVMTLFLFVIMTIDLGTDINKQTLVRYFPFTIILMGVLAALLCFVFLRSNTILPQQFVMQPNGYSNTQTLGEVLYTHYVYPFQLAAVLLLASIVAAISLNPRIITARKTQNIAQQVDIKKENRIRIVKMPPEKKS